MLKLVAPPFRSSTASVARVLGFIALAALLTLVPLAAFAQAAPPELAFDVGQVVAAFVSSLGAGNVGGAIALGFVLLVLLVRTSGKQLWPWLGTDEGGAYLNSATVIAAVLGAAALGGKPITWGLVWSAFLAAATIGGTWSQGRRLLRPLVGLLELIPGVGPVLGKILRALVGGDVKAKVAAEADAAYKPLAPAPTAAEADAQLFPKI
jgi:hypothetical protein